ncbi:MAG TPA: alpha/beta fold hydrolase [Syntrophales bacterium]|nr:alpha/beta fold hydrolase [Syntrophales bacterium]
MTSRAYRPSGWLKNTHVQTLLASSRLRVLGRHPMEDAASEVILDGVHRSRLQGFHSPQPGGKPRGLVILLHGWEGGADSAYIRSAGRCFWDRGLDVFRLNLRDHGKSHHLNEGLFHGALIDETHAATASAATLAKGAPCWIMGFSMGGNFALRMALGQGREPIPGLRRVFAVSPALDPYKSTLAIDEGPALYRRYFLNKWKRSLRKKERLFPERYRFGELLKEHDTCLGLTEAIMGYFPQFPDYRTYFRKYTLLDGTFRSLETPVTIFISADDPVIDVKDFRELAPGPKLDLRILSHGGHCGFFESAFPFASHHEREAMRMIEEECRGEVPSRNGVVAFPRLDCYRNRPV